MSNTELNLLQRINKVRENIEYIKKDKSVSTGATGSYKAVTHDAVTAMVRDHMVTFGIICYPVLVDSLMNPPAVDKEMNISKQSRYEATYDFHFCNMDKPEEEIVIRIQSHAMDNADKAPGKALSYAKKYAVLKLFEIETGDDEEGRPRDAGLDDERIELWIFRINAAEGEEKKKLWKEATAECTRASDVAAHNRIKEGVTPK